METRTRLDATIRKSWKLLSQDVPDFPPELGGQRPFALENSLTLTPLFYESEGRLQCAQVGYFGFYTLRAILRGILLSVNHLGAAKLSADHELYGPSIASAYAAAYHVTGSLLALHGHVFCELEDNIITGKRNELEMVAVLLTRKSTWICEHRNRTHRTRWLELAQVYGSTIEELPECFDQVFFYYYPEARPGYGPALLKFPQLKKFPQFNRPKPTLQDKFKDVLELIAASRHGALYATFGSDPHVFEALVNGDAHTTYGIGKQAELFVSFAESLLREVAGSTLDIIGELRDGKPRTWLFLCTYFPWFDSPKYEQLQNAELAEIIECIHRWLTEFARCYDAAG